MSDAVFVTAAGPEVGSGVRRASVCRGGVILSALVLAALMAPAFAAEEIRGRAKVVSGNEIIIGNRTIRLFGMSAPGLDDRCNIDGVEVKCGIIAWAELIKLADGRQISCDREALPPEAAAAATPKKKLVIFATCYIGEMDVNEALVRSGWASAVPEQTDRYEVDETDAKVSGRGMWSNDRKRRR